MGPALLSQNAARNKRIKVLLCPTERDISKLQLIYAMRQIGMQVFEQGNSDFGHECFHPEQRGQNVSQFFSKQG